MLDPWRMVGMSIARIFDSVVRLFRLEPVSGMWSVVPTVMLVGGDGVMGEVVHRCCGLVCCVVLVCCVLCCLKG
jgi:hypothetical protein